MDNTDKMIDVRNLWFSYERATVLSDVNFSVDKGSLCGLFGPNGCGKTTLFTCCLNFLSYPRGTVRMAGKNISRLSVSDMAKVVSYVPQEHAPPFPYLVEDIVLMGRSPHLRGVFGVSRKDRIKASDALSVVGMTEMARRPYTHLSGGQRQLVLMARAMAQETPVMFLDEPTSALDFSNQVRIWKLMREIVDGGVTILACSHDPNHVAWFCDDVVVMGSEGIMASGHPRDVITNATLGALYEESCSLSHAHGVPIVVPCSIHTHGGRQQ